ncbi:hypothetical protein H6763_04250 [Candidatus Nomurabacteria bacterium]|nr:hypothetical protein [Candidatus Nomurabacteria bacterium]
MKRNKTVLTLTLVMALLLTAVGAPLLSKDADAAAMINAYMLIDDIAAGRTAGATYVFAIQPSQSFTTPTLTIEFPIADDTEWCRTATDLTEAGVTASVADDGGSHDISAALPGTLAATCTQGNGTTTGDKITVTGITAITNGSVYGLSLTDGTTGELGTSTNGSHLVSVTLTEGANVDTMTFGVQLLTNPDVTVTATVAAAQTVTCSLSSNSVALGTLYAGGAYVTGTHTISASTSTTAEGYYWAVYGEGDGSTDAGLWKSSATTDLLASTGSGTIDLNTTEGFGLTASAASGATVAADFATGTAGQFGALDRTYSGAQMLTYQASAETGGDTSTITYGAKAGSGAQAGSYSETVTFICGGYY